MVTAFKQGMVVVKTDKHEASLPPTSFTYQKSKLYLGMTRAGSSMAKWTRSSQQVLRRLPSVQPSRVALEVRSARSRTIDEQYVTIKLVSGKFVKIPTLGNCRNA